jgi:ribosome-binding factor A
MPKEYPRRLRINVQLQRELTELIRSDLRDPRIAGVTVTQVDTSPDMRHAHVYISLLALDASPDAAVAALNRAAVRLRRELGHRLHIRYIPELKFSADRVSATADHLNRLIREARDEDRRHASDRGEPDS